MAERGLARTQQHPHRSSSDLTMFILLQAQACVITAAPMDDEFLLFIDYVD
jgi:hypothetical protein